MNPEQTSEFLNRARRVFTMVNEALSKPTGDGAVIAWQVRVDAWKATLSDVPFDDAVRCLDAIHRGDAGEDLRFPNDWRDRFPATVRKWCRANKSVEFSTIAIPRGDDDQPRYRCLDCRDSGHVVAMNAAYAAEHRHLVEGAEPLIRDDEPLNSKDADQMRLLRGWFKHAKRWCRLEGRGAFVATCVCYCDSPIAVARRAALSNRTASGCLYKPEKMPRVDAEDFITLWECFERFVQDVRPEQAHEWNPSAPLLGYDAE